MRRTEVYQVRLDVHEKKQAFAVFKQLGISPAQAIRLFFRQVVVTRSIPFPIEQAVSELDGEISVPKKKKAETLDILDNDALVATAGNNPEFNALSDQDVFDQLDELLKDRQ